VNEIQGVITAMATVFGEDGAIDFGRTRTLAARLVGQGSHGLVLAGTTGESPTLEDEEKLALLREVRAEVGEGVTLILGTGSNDTRHSVELTKAAAGAGADGGLVVTPYYNRPGERGIKAHFEAVAGAAPDLPIVIYNIPARVVVNIPVSLLAELAEIPNVVAVKQANDDDLAPIPGLDLLAGNDVGFLPTLKLGGRGGILVATHVAGPEMRRIWDLWQEGRHDEAAELDARLQPVYAAMGVAGNPTSVKACLEMARLCPATMRLPMVEATDGEKGRIREMVESAGISLG